MREVSQLTCVSLTQHSVSQPFIAACAGDGTCGSHLPRSIADANLTLSAFSGTRARCDRLHSCLRLRSRCTRGSPIARASEHYSIVDFTLDSPATPARRQTICIISYALAYEVSACQPKPISHNC